MRTLRSLLICTAIVFCFACNCFGSDQEQGNDTKGVWRSELTRDEFGDIDYDSEAILLGNFQGTFSNTATTGSDLSVTVRIDHDLTTGKKIFVYYLYEYGNNLMTYSNSDTITMKTKVGDVKSDYTLSGSAPNGPIMTSGNLDDGETLFSLLYYGNDIRTIIYVGNSEYRFTVESANIIDACQEAANTQEQVPQRSGDEQLTYTLNSFLNRENYSDRYKYIVDQGDEFPEMSSEEIEGIIDNQWLKIRIERWDHWDEWNVYEYANNSLIRTASFDEQSGASKALGKEKAYAYKIEDGILYTSPNNEKWGEDDYGVKGFTLRKLKNGYYYAKQVYGKESIYQTLDAEGNRVPSYEPYMYLYVLCDGDGNIAYAP